MKTLFILEEQGQFTIGQKSSPFSGTDVLHFCSLTNVGSALC